MGVQILDNFDIGQAKTLDSRMFWTGQANNLNNIPNKYQGLIAYVSGDNNLYVFQGGNPETWEKIVTTNVDSTINIDSSFTFSNIHNGQVLYVNSNQNITGFLPMQGPGINGIPSGYNVSIVQLGVGNVVFRGGGAGASTTFFRNRLNLDRTAGTYAVASILRLNQSEFLLYGDLV
jgi:hypothetical protein